jgi:gamma-glutamyl phosphate reductase
MAMKIVVNAKMRRTGICGSAETLLIDRKAKDKFVLPLITVLRDAGCEVRASEDIRAMVPGLIAATEEDWATEYLDAIISVTLVDGIEGAVDHISSWSSAHTEAVIAEDPAVVERFFAEVDSAICCTMRRPSLPMAVNSAWERRSALPPARCMRADRSASNNSLHSSTGSAATARQGRET